MINLSELLDRAKKKVLEKPDEKDGYAPKNPNELRFVRKHVRVITPDANGNGDDVFKGTNVKSVERQPNHGYNPGQDEKVYEEVERPTCKKCGKKHTGKNCPFCTKTSAALAKKYLKKSYASESKQINEIRMPLEGHPYHDKTYAQLRFIIKDAGKAAQAMRSHGNTEAENKYQDQVNDAATVLAYRNRGKYL